MKRKIETFEYVCDKCGKEMAGNCEVIIKRLVDESHLCNQCWARISARQAGGADWVWR